MEQNFASSEGSPGLKKRLRHFARRVASARVPPNRLFRLLAWEYTSRRFALSELQRVVYYQPMFESLCSEVGPGLRLDLTPDSKLPMQINCSLRLGQRVRLSARTTFSGARSASKRPVIRIGDSSYLGSRCVLRAGTGITLGKHVLIASNALLSSDPGHPMDAVARRTQCAPSESLGEISIGDDVWLAYNVAVLGHIRIGEGAVVAANSVVTKDVPPYSLVAGNPARVIRTLLRDGGELSSVLEALEPQILRANSG